MVLGPCVGCIPVVVAAALDSRISGGAIAVLTFFRNLARLPVKCRKNKRESFDETHSLQLNGKGERGATPEIHEDVVMLCSLPEYCLSPHVVYMYSISKYRLVKRENTKVLPLFLRADITMSATRLDLFQNPNDSGGKLAQVYRQVRSDRLCSRAEEENREFKNGVKPVSLPPSLSLFSHISCTIDTSGTTFSVSKKGEIAHSLYKQAWSPI